LDACAADRRDLCTGFLLLALMQDVDPHKIGLLMIYTAGEWSSSP